jgi:hypothetical protein
MTGRGRVKVLYRHLAGGTEENKDGVPTEIQTIPLQKCQPA